VVTVISLLQPALSAAQGTIDEAFARTVASYVNLHRSAESGLPCAPATDPATTQGLEAALARRIQALRPNAAPGDILGPMSGRPQGKAILEQTNVHGVKLRANHRYPPTLPRVTMPAQLLAVLPALPSELEYRFLGRSLVLGWRQNGL